MARLFLTASVPKMPTFFASIFSPGELEDCVQDFWIIRRVCQSKKPQAVSVHTFRLAVRYRSDELDTCTVQV